MQEPVNRTPDIAQFLSEKASYEMVPDHRERDQVVNEAYWAYSDDNYDKLELLATEYRRSKSRLLSGDWKLNAFYDGLILHSGASEERWATRLKKLRQWEQQKPQSVTAKIALAENYFAYAYRARGNGSASSVTPEGWRLFNERVNQAATMLAGAAPLVEKDPQWFVSMLELARLQGWPEPDCEKLYNGAVAFEPGYYPIYYRRAYYLLPRWHGEEGDWQKFALRVSATTPRDQREDLYARIVWYIWDRIERNPVNPFANRFLMSQHISWERCKQGFESQMRDHPNSLLTLNLYAWFACAAGDQTTARLLFQQVGDKWDRETWSDESNYTHARTWASAITPKSS
jgi:hypothetical protein